MNFDIQSIKRKMLVKYPLFGSIVANVKYKEDMNTPTAGTDGQTIYYNPRFLNTLEPDEQTFIFAHEVCHIAFDHMYCRDKFTILLFSLRIGKQRYPSLVSLF